MHVEDDRLQLSPSDVTAFLACEHLTTLSLAQARGELERPEVANEQAELIFRKGLEHEHAYLESLRAEGKTIREIELGEDEWERRGRRDGAGARATASTSSTRASSRRTAGAASPTSCCGSRTARTRRSTRSSPARAKPAYILQLLFYNEQLARLQGREPERIHVLLGSGEQASFRPGEFGAYYRRVRSRLERFVADPPPTEPLPVDHCRICDFKPLCDARWDAVDHLSRVAGVYRSQIERLATAGITTLAGSRARAARAALRRGCRPTRGRSCASRPSSSSGRASTARTATSSCSRSPRAASRSCRIRRRATSSSTSRATRSGTGTASLEYLWGILDVEGELHAAARARPRDRAAGVRDVHRPRPRAARALPRPARLPLRAVRDHRAQAADGPLRHARGGARRSAAPRRLRRSLQGRPRTACARRGPATG